MKPELVIDIGKYKDDWEEVKEEEYPLSCYIHFPMH